MEHKLTLKDLEITVNEDGTIEIEPVLKKAVSIQIKNITTGDPVEPENALYKITLYDSKPDGKYTIPGSAWIMNDGKILTHRDEPYKKR